MNYFDKSILVNIQLITAYPQPKANSSKKYHNCSPVFTQKTTTTVIAVERLLPCVEKLL